MKDIQRIPLRHVRGLRHRARALHNHLKWLDYVPDQLMQELAAVESMCAEQVEKRARPSRPASVRKWVLKKRIEQSWLWCVMCRCSHYDTINKVPGGICVVERARKQGVRPLEYTLCESCMRKVGLVW